MNARLITPKKHLGPSEPSKPHAGGQGSFVHSLGDSRIVLCAEGLRKSFGGQVVLDGVDIELRRGEVVLLRGENGSGKTTLLNILTGNLEPDSGVIQYAVNGSTRTYRFPRRWLQELNPWNHFRPEFVAREGIGRTWQDIRLFGSQSLRDNIAVADPEQSGEHPLRALLSRGWAGNQAAQINSKTDRMLAQLGLSGREDSSGDMVSLGQSKRVAIARAVAAGARVLFLDEPLAGLDRQGINEALALLEFLVRVRGLTLVLVEHVFNQQHLQGLVTTDWLLEGGRIQRSTLHVPASRPEASVRVHISKHSTQQPAWFYLLASDEAEAIHESLPRGARLTRIRRLDRFKQPANPILEITALIVRRGTRTVIGLDEDGKPVGFNLTLYQGEIAVLQAPNGWGKSTLCAAISGLIRPDAGSIHLNSKCMDELPTWERVRQGLSAFQSDRHTFPNLTGNETLKLAGNNGKVMDLGLTANRVASSMSGGQKQRLALLAHAVGAARASCQLFDEPFSMLDQPSMQEAARLLHPSPDAAILVAVPSSIH